MTSTMPALSSCGSSIARLSSPRSPTEPTMLSGSCPETTGSWETRCSCSSATASRTRWPVCTATNCGISPASVFVRSTSPTVRSSERARNPCWVIQASLKILLRYARPPSGRITATIACGSSISLRHLERRVHRQPARAADEQPLDLREPARGEERVAVGDGHVAVDHGWGRRSRARSPRRRPRRGTGAPRRWSRSSRRGRRR